MSLDFVQLPDDVLVRILLLCEVGDLFACKPVCRRLLELIESDVYLQYNIELAINGMVDVSTPASTPDMPVVERLEKLRAYGERFRSGDFRDSEYTYSWQLWPAIPSMPTDGWQAFPAFGSSISYVVVKPPQQEISVCAPPFQDGDGGMRHWSISLKAFPAADIVAVSVDLSQDLLIVAQSTPDNREVQVYVRSFTKPEQSHPAAARGLLSTRPQVRSDGDAKMKITYVQIHRQVVAWMLADHGRSNCDVEVWDWKSGYRVWCCHFDRPVTFALLDRSFLAVTSYFWDSLIVYRFDSPETEPVSSGDHVLVLGLPGGKHARIQESSIPSPPPSTVAFWPDPAMRIFVVVLGEDASLLIPYSTFRALLDPLQASSPASLAWESWGPKSTLSLNLEVHGFWQMRYCYSYSSRVAVFYFDKDSRSHHGDVIIFDLNPWAVRHAQHRLPTTSADALHKKTLRNPKAAFRTDRAALPHLVLHGPGVSVGLGQTPPILTMDHRGFTAVYTRNLMWSRFLGSTSYYA